MPAHIGKLKEQLDAKVKQLQEREETIESIRKLAMGLEALKQKLSEKLAESENQQREVQTLQSRLEVLTAAEPVINAAMHTKSSTEDVVKHVVETAIQSDHLTASEIMNTTLDLSMQINGCTCGDNLGDFLFDSVDKEEALMADIESAMAKFADANDVVKLVLKIALKNGTNVTELRMNIDETLDAMLGLKEVVTEPNIKTGGELLNVPRKAMPPALRLMMHSSGTPKQEMPSDPQPEAASSSDNTAESSDDPPLNSWNDFYTAETRDSPPLNNWNSFYRGGSRPRGQNGGRGRGRGRGRPYPWYGDAGW
ncbi:hypothetical protein Daus18300_005494 [Diaporthe australafricana]|uniref:Uncharacterized protein n=1 Tax=Diaporthe australafricana TaxID=127596 RepID=A0ABR3X1G4_9PEZI